MRHPAPFLVIAVLIGITACHAPARDPFTAQDLTHHGCLRGHHVRGIVDGTALAVSGYVDIGNVFGDDSARIVLGEFWNGPSRDGRTWRFDLKGRADDPLGHGFAVWVATDAGRDALLRKFSDDARRGRATQVLVRGTAHTFDAPGNLATRRCLEVEVQGSQGVVVLE